MLKMFFKQPNRLALKQFPMSVVYQKLSSEMTHTSASYYDEQPVAVLNALDMTSERSSKACIPSIES